MKKIMAKLFGRAKKTPTPVAPQAVNVAHNQIKTPSPANGLHTDTVDPATKQLLAKKYKIGKNPPRF